MQYRAKGATDKKYIDDFKAEILIDSVIYEEVRPYTNMVSTFRVILFFVLER